MAIHAMLSPNQIKQEAKKIGFHLVGISGDVSPRHHEFYTWWLSQGFAGDMHYLHRQKNRRSSIQEILPNAQSVIVCGLRFPGLQHVDTQDTEKENHETSSSVTGKIARYAQGEDYHQRIHDLLEQVIQKLQEREPLAQFLAYVDTGAIPERALAAQAGLGWIGKNSMLIHPEEGSWFWLGEILTTLKLSPDIPLADRCGTCRKCINACPTQAIPEALRTIDSRKCISYLTIEHRGEIPEKFRAAIGDWLVGCDICQEVCPWNSHSLKKARLNEGAPPLELFNINTVQEMSTEEFNQHFRKRAISRTKLSGLKRNAGIVLENKKLNTTKL